MALGSSKAGLHIARAVVLLAAVAGCASKPPPAAPAVVATVSPVEKAPPPVRPAPPPRPVDLRWTFISKQPDCAAIASGPGGSFQIQTSPDRRVVVTAKFTVLSHAVPKQPSPAKLSFSGPAGSWVLTGIWRNRAFTDEQPLDEHAVADILGLLGGGIAVVTAGPLQLGDSPAASGEWRWHGLGAMS